MSRTAYFLFFILSGIILFSSCDPKRFYEKNKDFKNADWSYNDKPEFFVTIKDTSDMYNILFNIRHTGNYKYSNLFILFSILPPGDTIETQRYEFRLANPDGEWLGSSGLGDIYSNRIPMIDSVRFPKPGIYKFIIEQNMRDNPLSSIEDVGLRIEKI